MNYRDFYENSVCEIKEGYEIHHLDEDRDNNCIDNLLLLPSELHNKYHNMKANVEVLKVETDIKSVIENGNAYSIYLLSSLIEFNKVLKECNKWKDYKMYRLGLLSNIHNIKY